MKFGPVPVADALGAILAHGLAAPGGSWKKGHCLTAADLAALAATGLESVIVARAEADDIGEDAAAAALGAALALPETGLRAGLAATGRTNLMATGPGLLLVDRAAVDRVNDIDPMITLATLPALARVGSGAMVATVKIISYAVPRVALAQALAAAAGALRIAPPQIATATLIETLVPGPAPGPKGRLATAARLERLNCKLGPPMKVPHQVAPLAEAIARATGELVLILTGSATSDIDDVAPAAIRQAGGNIIRFGMPVDPGNLLVLGSLAGRPVIGLPGCARSLALNGADWVIDRLVCGLEVGAADIAAMGVGGLLKDIPGRIRPR